MAEPAQLRLVLNVRDLSRSLDFYTRLGFVPQDEADWTDQFVSLRRGEVVLDLMRGIFPQPLLLHLMTEDQAAAEELARELEGRGVDLKPEGPGGGRRKRRGFRQEHAQDRDPQDLRV